jgi:C4-dicarboxylate-specific signal transduction histidine kinase
MMRLVKEKNQFLQGLISSNRAIGISALANSLAHQLSQPITGVILQTESVKRSLYQLEGQGKSIDALNTVSEQLKRLSDLVNNLRRVFSGKGSEFQSVNVQVVCDEILEIIEPTIRSENIQLVKEYKSNPQVVGNTIQIQQVLINLFNNAIDAIVSSNSKVRAITLTVSEGESFALVSIQDSGNGISKEVKKSIFEIYQTTKKDGIGIGLWLCKEIIDRHEGSIHAANSAQGGATFEVRLPLSNQFNGDQ